MKRILVTGAGGPLGVNVSRSLRKAPEPVFLVGTDANLYHLPLALTDATALVPPARQRDAYREALVRLVRKHGLELIIPTHPVEVRAIAEIAGSLPVRTILPRVETLDVADDKLLTNQVLGRQGVPVPRSLGLRSPEDLQNAFDVITERPVWIRGTGAPGLGIGGAALPCRDVETAHAWIDHNRGFGGDRPRMMACAYLPGINLTWMSVWSGGKLWASQGRERLEYILPHVSPSGVTGAPAVTRTVNRTDLDELGQKAVLALDARPNGAYFVDLKGDASDAPRVTEINAGRCGTTIHFYTEAGFNFPWLLTQLAYGEDPSSWVPRPTDVLPEDVYWIRTLDCGPVLLRGRDAFDKYRGED
jgi:carbamoyl-phosphate synthase large subunit